MFGPTRSRKRTKSSRLLDDYLFGNNFLKSPRDRSGSLSSTNGRTRLISNVSIGDNFDEYTKFFNPNEFFQTIEDFSSEESDRAIVADDPNQASTTEKRCYHCSSVCEVWKKKWRYVSGRDLNNSNKQLIDVQTRNATDGTERWRAPIQRNHILFLTARGTVPS